MLHCRMLDGTAQLQQEALGVLGVNFIHGVLTNSGGCRNGVTHFKNFGCRLNSDNCLLC